ncbi:P1 family peptidase [Piscinibacter koreensis]|uniref:P1 family peptidase n=1 Tax=Piscinibacter koreensis TaxID=2742824 RepID=A0A7Y6NMT5_9BURK|nr:P1 family peptidase [Schlegelella koreensis]NUZ06042.1 P1 family peptidase [Schlegelella koreensis]
MRLDSAFGALLAVALAAPAVAQTLPQNPGPKNAITDVPGIEVGQYTATNGTGGMTGTTAIIARGGAIGGVTQRGGAPGTRETDILKSEKAVGVTHAVVLTGGSAYGLAAADGVMSCLESQGIGTPVLNRMIVPLVPAAVIFDPGRCAPFNFRPDASFGVNACRAANNGAVAMGNVGAGAGARSGGVKGGLGTASAVLPGGIVVGAIVAVNSSGRTFDAATGQFFAGYIAGTSDLTPTAAASAAAEIPSEEFLRATTIAVVATNATLTKAQANKVAQMADDGMARALRIAHGTGDGDTVFALATGTVGGTPNLNQIGGAAADALSRAIVRAIIAAQGIHTGSGAGACNVSSYCEQFPQNCRR